ncbi:MOB kinase activator-like 1A [Zingiber officinale]|uniref:MOB kinase activator-like 1A n=1 Tax=Zingiber officinale TaxID=94328 RepID=UPI001C4DC126|nr:MOB kinase activator-like 1A [Zingiber officinale]
MGWKKLVVMSVEATTQLSGVPLSMATVHDLVSQNCTSSAILKVANTLPPLGIIISRVTFVVVFVSYVYLQICTCRYEYRWADGVQTNKPIEVSAPKYVEYLMEWIEVQLDDESIFPQKLGTPFPANFKDVVKTIFKRLFRVYAHIYHSHFQKIVSLKEEAHLNTCFKHFILFTYEFGLIDKKEITPLQELIESIVL